MAPARADLDEVFAEQRVDAWPLQVLFLGFMAVAVLLLQMEGNVDGDPRLLWVFAGFLIGNAVFYRLLVNWPGPAALVSLGMNTLLVALALELSGGATSLLWPLFLLPIITAGLILPTWTIPAAGLQTALLLVFYAEWLREDPDTGIPEVAVKAGFLLVSAWMIGRYGERDRSSRKALDAAGKRQAELQRELERAQKLEALGALAGEAAHDFKNTLHIIMSYVESTQEKLGARAPSDALQRIDAAAQKGDRLVSELLTFGIHRPERLSAVDLRGELERLRGVIETISGRRVPVQIAVEDGLNAVNADPEQLTQVLVNLAQNARDAMPEGGTLTLRASRVRRGPEEMVDPSVPEGDWALLTVSDSGTGMSAEVLAHVFEPFFTTKKGRGTGLGLASVYGMVRRFGGHITVESADGSGTTFRIYLPFAAA